MGLLESIRKNKEIRRLFGEKELDIIEKQLLGIPLKKSETIRLSRDIRKKFEVIKEISEFKDEFELKKAAKIKSLIEEAKEAILDNENFRYIKKIFLFGSYAENKPTFRSDIDIAVEFDESYKITEKEATKFRIQISGEVSDKVDIQVFNVLPEKIKKSILNNHKILYNNERR